MPGGVPHSGQHEQDRCGPCPQELALGKGTQRASQAEGRASHCALPWGGRGRTVRVDKLRRVPVVHTWEPRPREGQKLPKSAQSMAAEPGAPPGLPDAHLRLSLPHPSSLFLDLEAGLPDVAGELCDGEVHISEGYLDRSGGKLKITAAYFLPKKAQAWTVWGCSGWLLCLVARPSSPPAYHA